MKELIQRLSLLWYGFLAVCATTLCVLVLYHSNALVGVSIQLKDGAKDYMDTRVPLVTKKGDELPDYRMDVYESGRWLRIGTKPNQSAQMPLLYLINDAPSLSRVQGIRVMEDDLAEDDLVDEVNLAGQVIEGAVFEFQLQTEWRLSAGFDWFITTRVGQALLLALVIVVVLIFLSRGGVDF